MPATVLRVLSDTSPDLFQDFFDLSINICLNIANFFSLQQIRSILQTFYESSVEANGANAGFAQKLFSFAFACHFESFLDLGKDKKGF